MVKATCTSSQENYFWSISWQNNNNNSAPTYLEVRLPTVPTHIISVCVKSVKSTRFLYFSLNQQIRLC